MDRDVAYANMPQHTKPGSKVPRGGNQVFIDGSARWIKAETMLLLTSWITANRAGDFFQESSNFPPTLVTALPGLEFP